MWYKCVCGIKLKELLTQAMNICSMPPSAVTTYFRRFSVQCKKQEENPVIVDSTSEVLPIREEVLKEMEERKQ